MKKLIAGVFAALAASALCFAEGLSFYTTTDFAYYPKSNYVAGTETHFAPLTGWYSGLEGRVTGHLNYTLPTPLGTNWLVSGANLVFDATTEITPVSVKPGVNVKFTPVPFLVFSAGAEIGTGWDLAGLRGMAEYTWDGVSDTYYTDLTPFVNYYYKAWAQGTFQFDTGAIWKGDWTHIQTMYTYQVYYEGITGMPDGDIWEWQIGDPKVNGLRNYQNFILAYGLPSVCNRIGVMVESDGYYNDCYNKDKYGNYWGNFQKISISPLVSFQFTPQDSLNCLLGFSSRRVFALEHDSGSQEPTGVAVVNEREWYFNRIALSYTHKFF